MPISISSRKKTLPTRALISGRNSTGGHLTVGCDFGEVVAYTDQNGLLRLELTEAQLRAAVAFFDGARDRSAERFAWANRAQEEARS